MNNDPYVRFYVSRKSILFPLIEKYTGRSPRLMTHGEAAATYIDLLRMNPAFKSEVDSGITQAGFKNAAGLIGGVISTITGVISSGSSAAEEKAKQDTALYNAILTNQGGSDTTKILIVSGVAVVFVVIGVLIIRSKK
jgi:hypothetical protein